MRNTIHQYARGRVQIQVVEDGQVVRSLPWQDNLILDQGLDMVCADRTWAASFTHCAAGTGTSVATAGQTDLDTELVRSGTYLTGSGNCGGTLAGNVLTLKRTFDFTAEVGSVTYTEIGLSYTASVAANLFSRIKLATGVSFAAGQALRVIYELSITLTPDTLTAKDFDVTGWPVAPSTVTDGDECWQAVGIASVNTSGAVINFEINPVMEPSVSANCKIWLSPSADAPGTPFSGTYPARTMNSSSAAVSLVAYTPGNFYRDKTVTFAVGDANRTDYFSMGLGDDSTAQEASTCTSFVCVFDEAQTKDNMHSLTLTFRFTVGRI